MNRTTANALEAVVCIGLIAGMAFLIITKQKSAEARTVCRYNEFLGNTTCQEHICREINLMPIESG